MYILILWYVKVFHLRQTLLIKYYRGIGNCDFLLIFAWNRCPLLTSSNMTVKCMLTKLVGFSLILFRTCTHRTALQINIRPIAYDTAKITNSNTFQNACKNVGDLVIDSLKKLMTYNWTPCLLFSKNIYFRVSVF